MPDRPLCEVCGKPEAVWGADEDSDALCWAEATGGGHSRQSVLEVLRATRRERDEARAELLEMDALRARLASLPVAELVAYGMAREAWVAHGRYQDGNAVNEAYDALAQATKRWREWACPRCGGAGHEGECGR